MWDESGRVNKKIPLKKPVNIAFQKGFAERLGFEPRVHFWRTHTFQACSFDHSDTSPGIERQK